MRTALAAVVLLTAIRAENGSAHVSEAFRRAAERARTIQSRSSAIVRENLQKPALGLDREFDRRLPSLTDMKTLPIMQFTPRTTLILSDWLLRLGYLLNSVRSPDQDRKIQDDKVPEWVPFPCERQGTRSPKRPDRADRVRPGDIDVVAAFGDSLTAGSGVTGYNINQNIIANRGLSWAIGGQGTWRDVLTLPNIMKELNPNLVGYSTGDTLWSQHYQNQQYNLAEPGAIVDDLPLMAQTLVYKLQRDRRVDILKDWKLVTIMMGSVDFCLDICFWKRPQDAPRHFGRLLQKTLDYLMDNSPRTIVNVVNTPNLARLLFSIRGLSPWCDISLKYQCPCLFGDSFEGVKEEYESLVIETTLNEQQKVAEAAKYRSKPDFRVVWHPMFRNLTIPRTKSGRSDSRYLASDCFHLSQRTHALAGRTLWNSLLTPVGMKPVMWNLNAKEDLICPTPGTPYQYIATD